MKRRWKDTLVPFLGFLYIRLLKATVRLGDNDRDYRHGDELFAALWMAFPAGESAAINTGVRFRGWRSIEGSDPGMDPAREPGQDPVSSSGFQVVLPAGIHLRVREGILSGTELHVEFFVPVHQEFDSPRLSGDWGFEVALSGGVDLF